MIGIIENNDLTFYYIISIFFQEIFPKKDKIYYGSRQKARGKIEDIFNRFGTKEYSKD